MHELAEPVIDERSVLTVGGSGELAASSETVGHETLEKDGAEVRTAEIDCSGMTSRSRSNDDLSLQAKLAPPDGETPA